MKTLLRRDVLKALVLLAQLALAFHGDVHPAHEEHRDNRRRHAHVSR